MTLPFSTRPSFVVPPPMSILRMRLRLVARYARGAGTVGREHRLHVMSGGRGDELAALFGENSGNAFRILAPQRFAGEDDDAGVDLVGRQFGGGIGVVDNGAERGVVDALLALIGRKRDRRLEQSFARDDVVAAGKVFREAAQMNAREDHLRAGRSDIDADRHQRDIVLTPEWIVLQRTVVGIEIMVVIVIGIVGVRVHHVPAIEMVGEGMAPWFLVFALGHLLLSLHAGRA